MKNLFLLAFLFITLPACSDEAHRPAASAPARSASNNQAPAAAPPPASAADRQAPEFPADAIWLGTDHPPTMASLKGKVVLVDFWEYTCINCIRTFPHLKEWYARYHRYGLEIIGVQKGEFAFSSEPANIERAYKRFMLPYPAIADIHDRIWDAYHNDTWPASYLIDGEGRIRTKHEGEGNYGTFEREIQAMLKEIHPDADFSAYAVAPDAPIFGPDCGTQSEEVYVGAERGTQWGGEMANREGFQPDRTVTYRPTERRVERGIFVAGTWTNRADYLESAGNPAGDDAAYVGVTYHGRDVYSVLTRTPGGPVSLVITRDGHPVPPAQRGKDIAVDAAGRTYLTIDESRMYYAISREDDAVHELRLEPIGPGVRICSFCFGNRCLENFDRL
ncbi:MAG TPA: redoxin domain-containing protein [Candidatus Kapabacteria bacterium]|nr:redoxin domain-containing protein [Candidatus Kapabacteria bacterium]